MRENNDGDMFRSKYISDIKCDTTSDTSFDTSFDTICDKIDFYEITRYITC